MSIKAFAAIFLLSAPAVVFAQTQSPQPPPPATSQPLNPGQCTVACWTSGGGGGLGGSGGGIGGSAGGGGFQQTCKLFCAPMIEKPGLGSSK